MAGASGRAQVTPSNGLLMVVPPSPTGGLLCATAKRISGASSGVTLYEASIVEATVVPLPASPASYAATVVSERTTLAAAAGRSCHASEYGAGGAATTAGAATGSAGAATSGAVSTAATSGAAGAVAAVSGTVAS